MAWDNRNEILRAPTTWEEYGEPFMEALRSMIPGGISYNRYRTGEPVRAEDFAQDLGNLATVGASGAFRGVGDLGRNLLNQRALAKQIPELGERLYSMGTPLTNIPKAIARKIGGWGKQLEDLVPTMERLEPAMAMAEEGRIPVPLQKLTERWTNNWLGRLGVNVPYVADPKEFPVSLIPRNRAAQRGVYEAIFDQQLPLNANAYYRPYAPNNKWLADVISVARDAPDPLQSVKHEGGHLASTRVRGYHPDYTNTPVRRMVQDRARFVSRRPGTIGGELGQNVSRNVNEAIQNLPNQAPDAAMILKTNTGYWGPQIGEEMWTRSQALDRAGNPQIGGIHGLLEDPFWKTMTDVRKSYTHPSWYQKRPDLPGPPALLSYAEQFLANAPRKVINKDIELDYSTMLDTLRQRAQDYIKQYGDFTVKNFNLDR